MPTDRCAASQLAIVAAFAVCVRPQKVSYVSKLPTSLLVVVHAWLIATRKTALQAWIIRSILEAPLPHWIINSLFETIFVYTTSAAAENQDLF